MKVDGSPPEGWDEVVLIFIKRGYFVACFGMYMLYHDSTAEGERKYSEIPLIRLQIIWKRF